MITPQEIMDLPTLPQNPREYLVLMRGRPMVALSLHDILYGNQGRFQPSPLERKTLTAREYKDAVNAGTRMLVLEER